MTVVLGQDKEEVEAEGVVVVDVDQCTSFAAFEWLQYGCSRATPFHHPIGVSKGALVFLPASSVET